MVKWKSCIGQSMLGRKVAWSFYPLSGCTTLPAPWCFHQPSSSSHRGLLWRFQGIGIIDEIIGLWWLTYSLALFLSLVVSGSGGTENSNPLIIMPWSFWWPTPVLKLSGGPQPPLVSLPFKRPFDHPGDLESFRQYVPGTRDKDQIFIFISH